MRSARTENRAKRAKIVIIKIIEINYEICRHIKHFLTISVTYGGLVQFSLESRIKLSEYFCISFRFAPTQNVKYFRSSGSEQSCILCYPYTTY